MSSCLNINLCLGPVKRRITARSTKGILLEILRSHCKRCSSSFINSYPLNRRDIPLIWSYPFQWNFNIIDNLSNSSHYNLNKIHQLRNGNGLINIRGLHNQHIQGRASSSLVNITNNSIFEPKKEEEKPENLHPLDKYVFQISSDIRRKGRLNRKDIESAVNLLELETSIGDHGIFLFTCLGPTLPDVKPLEKVRMAHKLWNAIERESKLTFESLKAFLKCYAENHCDGIPACDALNLLRKVEATLSQSEVDGRELKPSQRTYYYVLLSYCLNGDLHNAVKMLNMVKDDGIPVDEEYFNALIIGNSRAGDIRSAQGILEILTAVNIEPSEKTFATLMQSYIENNSLAEMENIYTLAINQVTFPQRRMLKLLNIAVIKRNVVAFKKILNWIPANEKFDADVVNTVISLIHVGFPDEALDVLLHFAVPSKVSDEPFGTFLVKEMILADTELPWLVKACDTLKDGEKYNKYAWNTAAEYSLKYKKFITTFLLFELMKERNIPIRPHYFWPIIIHQFDTEGLEGLLGVIKKMHSFDVAPDWETVYDFIIPRMFKETNSALQVAKVLKVSANLSYSSGILKAILLYLLKQKRLTDASYLVTKIKGTLSQPQCLVENLFNNLLKFEERDNIDDNLKLALPILKSIYENAPSDDKTDFIGNFLVRFVDAVGVGMVDMINKFIQSLQTNGIRVSHDAARFLEGQRHLTIRKMDVDSDLIFLLDHHKSFLKPNEMNARDLASHAEELKAKIMNERGTLRHLFLKYCQNNDLTAILNLKQRFEQDYGPLSPGMLSSLLGVYIRHDKLEPAIDLYNSLRTSHKNLEIDFFKIIDLATLMANNSLTDEAFSFLLIEFKDQRFKIDDKKYTVRNSVALLEAFHKNSKDGKEVKNVLDFLLENNLVEPCSPVLGVVIKHLIKMNELEAAVQLFIEYSKQYNVTPCRQQLICSILDREDLLEKVLSSCKERYGEVNTRHYLAFCLSDTDNISGATAIFSDLLQQNRLNSHSILKQAEYYGTRKEINKLLNLIKTMRKAAPAFNCSNIYLIALKSCEISRCENDVRLVLSSIQEHEDFVSSSVLRYVDELKNILSTK